MSWLWMLLPDEFLPLLFAGVGLAIVLRILNVRAGVAILGGFCLSLLLGPFVDAIFDLLPAWLTFLVLLFFGMSALRWVLRLLLGERAADHVVGSLAADLVKGLLSLLMLPLRFIFLGLRRRRGR